MGGETPKRLLLAPCLHDHDITFYSIGSFLVCSTHRVNISITVIQEPRI